MREYLLELRIKANKTQHEVNSIVSEKLGAPAHYGRIERGNYLKSFTPEQAEALALALDTTADYIISCELTRGGYVGANINNGYNADNRVKGFRREYNEPLNFKERAFAESYLKYADRLIILLQRAECYSFLLNNLMSAEDFYDIGMLSYLRAVKALFVFETERQDFMDTVIDKEIFYKCFLRKRIKAGIFKYVHSQFANSRKVMITSDSMDAEINENSNSKSEESEANMYSFVPAKERSVADRAISSWTLDVLYRHLTPQQVSVCKALISGGWSASELINLGYTTKRDVGIIKFYLKQMMSYGKILWEVKDYENVERNVKYDFSANVWSVAIVFEKKEYNLGIYKDLVTALDVQKLAESHCLCNDLPEWFSLHLRPGINRSAVFIYPSPCDADIDWDNLKLLPENIKNRSGSAVSEATRENPVGIRLKEKTNTYTCRIGNYNLGNYKTFDEAFEVRKAAEKHQNAGDFEEWFTDLKESRKNKTLYACIEYSARSNTWAVRRRIRQEKTSIALGTYRTREEALNIKQLADEHIDAGDFDEWVLHFRKKEA